MHLQLPDTTGEDLVPKLRELYPAMHIIILTANNSIYSIKLLLNQGARGYLLKNLEQELLAEAIESVYAGEIFLSSELQMRLLKLNKSQNRVTAGNLTPREIEILKLITEEYTTQEIADLLSNAKNAVYQGKLFIDPSIKEDLLQEILITKRKSHNIDSKITIREKEHTSGEINDTVISNNWDLLIFDQSFLG